MDPQAANFTETTLVLPGEWHDHADLLNELSDEVKEVSGNVAWLRPELGVQAVGFWPRNEDLLALFAAQVQRGVLEAEEFEEIAAHTSVATVHFPRFLAAPEGALLTMARGVAYGVSLLERGAVGLKIEASGATRSRALWSEHSAQFLTDAVAVATAMKQGPCPRPIATKAALSGYDTVAMFELISDQIVYTCGGHLLALPDLELEGIDDGDLGQAPHILRAFLPEMLASRSVPAHWIDSMERRWRVSHHPCTRHAPNVPFHNPRGYLRLTLA